MCKISSIIMNSMTNIILETNPDYVGWEKDYERVFRTKERVMSVTRDDVDMLIASDAVVIFSKTRCPYCKMAKEAFDKLKRKYKAIELDERNDGEEILTILGEMTGARTVPRVFIQKSCIGGGTRVKALYESGELQNMIHKL